MLPVRQANPLAGTSELHLKAIRSPIALQPQFELQGRPLR